MTLADHDQVVVVGAGLAGWRLCEALRREGYAGVLTLVGEERHPPYDRPPLSKQVMSTKWAAAATTLATPERLAEAGVAAVLGARAIALEGTSVTLEDGRVVHGTHVVIATGARARRPEFAAGDAVHTLRTRDDARSLVEATAALSAGAPVVIIGGGFIGAEVATALRSRGLSPVVLEMARRPLEGVLGPEVALWLGDLAANAGVDLRTDQRVTDVVAHAGGLRVTVADAAPIDAPVVVAATGAAPNVEWLADSGLTLDNGVVVDEDLMAASYVAAIGDVARFVLVSASGREPVRVEHWQTANDHATALARHWTGAAPENEFVVPYFWSDQYGKKIQLLGHPRADDEVVRVLAEEGRFTALYHRDGVVTGVVTLSHPRSLMLSKVLLTSRTTLDEALARAPWAG